MYGASWASTEPTRFRLLAPSCARRVRALSRPPGIEQPGKRRRTFGRRLGGRDLEAGSPRNTRRDRPFCARAVMTLRRRVVITQRQQLIRAAQEVRVGADDLNRAKILGQIAYHPSLHREIGRNAMSMRVIRRATMARLDSLRRPHPASNIRL